MPDRPVREPVELTTLFERNKTSNSTEAFHLRFNQHFYYSSVKWGWKWEFLKMERQVSVGLDRPVKEYHLWRWTTFSGKFPPGLKHSTYVSTEISGNFGIMKSTLRHNWFWFYLWLVEKSGVSCFSQSHGMILNANLSKYKLLVTLHWKLLQKQTSYIHVPTLEPQRDSWFKDRSQLQDCMYRLHVQTYLRHNMFSHSCNLLIFLPWIIVFIFFIIKSVNLKLKQIN